MSLRAAIVGCGRIGCGFDEDFKRTYVSTHARAYLSVPGIELAALCDSDDAKLQKYAARFGVPKQYTNYEGMFRNEKLDVVSVCTPGISHLDIIRAALDSGVRGIFCEKPIADSLEAAGEIVTLSVSRNVPILIGHQRRFDPMHQQLSRFVRDDGLGRVQQVTCYYTAGVANTGSHLFDLLRLYLGDCVWAEGRLNTSAPSNPDDPNIDGWLGFAGGTTVAIQGCDVSAYTIFEIVLMGTKGRLRISSHGFKAEFEEARESVRYSGYRELFAAPLPVQGEFSLNLLPMGVSHLVSCMHSGAHPTSSAEDGRAALEIICALRQSALGRGKRIILPSASCVLSEGAHLRSI